MPTCWFLIVSSFVCDGHHFASSSRTMHNWTALLTLILVCACVFQCTSSALPCEHVLLQQACALALATSYLSFFLSSSHHSTSLLREIVAAGRSARLSVHSC